MKRGIGRARALSREDDDNVPKRACVESQSQPQPQTSASVQSVPSTSRQTTPPSTAAAGRANPLYSICETRPTDLASKKGLSGTPVNIQANFFRLLKRPSWSLYQYRVDFTPEVLDTRLSKALIAQQRPNFGCGYLFDGTLLYLPKKLETVGDKIVFQSKSRENDDYVVELKFTLEVSMQTSMAMQILNLILRKATAGLKLQLVGRNYFDAAAKVGCELCTNFASKLTESSIFNLFLFRLIFAAISTYRFGQATLRRFVNTNQTCWFAAKSHTKWCAPIPCMNLGTA